MVRASSPKVELLPFEQHEHLLSADSSIEVLICLLCDLLHLVEILWSRSACHVAQLLVSSEKLASVNLPSKVAIVFLEDHFNLLLKFHVIVRSPSSTRVTKRSHAWGIYESRLTIHGLVKAWLAVSLLAVSSWSTEPAVCIEQSLLPQPLPWPHIDAQ